MCVCSTNKIMYVFWSLLENIGINSSKMFYHKSKQVARTNKMWILKKKQQQAKQKSVSWEKTRSNEWMRRNYENPKWHEYEWFVRSGKRICDVTSCREDPDGYRLRRKPSWWEPTFVDYGMSSRWYKRFLKRWFKMRTR